MTNKEHFEKFYLNLVRKNREDYLKLSDQQILKKFYRMDTIFQNAMWLEFFDSLGLKIIISPSMFIDDWSCDIFGWADSKHKDLTSRQEAIKKGIEVAKEIVKGSIFKLKNMTTKRETFNT